jgi:toxin ParE1/3/4
MKLVKFHGDAELELIAAAAYYENQKPALGRRFLISIQDAINRVLINPELYPIVDSNVRRCLVRTFPFGIIFRLGAGSHSNVRAELAPTRRREGALDSCSI